MRWADGQLLGEYTMRSFGESPREENASHLLQILQDSAHQKYCLSAKACAGILRRAEKRGKELPKELKEALEQHITNNTIIRELMSSIENNIWTVLEDDCEEFDDDYWEYVGDRDD